MKKNLLFLAVFFIMANTFAQCEFGNYPPPYSGTPLGTITNGFWLANKFTLSSPASLTGLGMEGISSTGSTFRLAIYTDVSNVPGTLLAETNLSSVVAGPNVLNVIVPINLPAGDYWIACTYGAAGMHTAYTNTGTCYKFSGGPGTPALTSPNWSPAGVSITFNYWAVINTPTLTVTGPTSICQGNSTTLTAGGASTYTWSTGSTASAISVSPSSSTSYTLNGTNSLGCKASITQNMIVNPLPVVVIAGSNTICSFSTLTLTASGASTYSWSNGSTASTLTDTPTSNTSYSVYGTDLNGCTSYTFKPIGVAASSLTINGPTLTCTGAVITLTASGATTYTWSNMGVVNTPTVSVTPMANTIYNVNATEPNGCLRDTNILVTTIASPSLQFAASNSLLCTGQTGSISVSGANTYTWNTLSTNPTIVISPTVTTTYTVTGEGSNGCMQTATVTQTVSNCTGVHGIEKRSALFTIYPNPGNGIYTIRSDNYYENTNAELFDGAGNLILTKKLHPGEMTLDIKNFDSGFYYLKFKGSRETSTIKVIKE